jgi:DNA primase
MPGIDFREARARLPLAAVLDLLGFVPHRRAGDQVRGACPVHGSRESRGRSLVAHLGRGVWHCFRGGAGGNVLDLWAAVTRLPLHAAALDRCRRLGREVPWLPAAGPRRRNPRAGRTIMPDP